MAREAAPDFVGSAGGSKHNRAPEGQLLNRSRTFRMFTIAVKNFGDIPEELN